MKGKWAEGLTRVMGHLLNFSRDNVHYGIIWRDQPTGGTTNSNKVDLATINNKLYLGKYASQAEFWSELGSLFAQIPEDEEMR